MPNVRNGWKAATGTAGSGSDNASLLLEPARSARLERLLRWNARRDWWRKWEIPCGVS